MVWKEKKTFIQFFFSASFPPKKTLCPKNVLKKKKMSEKRLCPQMFSHSFSLKKESKNLLENKIFFSLAFKYEYLVSQKKEKKSSLEFLFSI